MLMKQNKTQINLGIIGLGNMGSGHLANIVAGKCPSVRISAVCDIDTKKLDRATLPTDIRKYNNYIDMLESGVIDTALIAVPHYSHSEIAIACFEHGINVLTEKPAGVYTRQVRKMIEAADRSGLKFGIMFNQRTNPLFAKAREIVKSGELGKPKRLVWIITNWYRTQAYYNSSPWRATWNGEGGGVLLNQAPHNLDIWQWIFGMPDSIYASCDIGKYHNISVEDDVTIIAKYKSGARATFITTTGETPGTNRLEISGELGKLVIEEGKLRFWHLHQNERDLCFGSTEGFIEPEYDYSEFSADEPEGHLAVLETFARSIIDGTRSIADGREGLNSLMISNAAYLSSILGREIPLPIDEDLFEHHLSLLRKSEKENGDPRDIKKISTQSEHVDQLSQRWKVRW